MANISSAFGTMTLKGWDLNTVKLLDCITDVWSKWYYSIQIEPFYDNEIDESRFSQSFSGSGRWTFENNLESLSRWTKDEIKNDRDLFINYHVLLYRMAKRDLCIDVSLSLAALADRKDIIYHICSETNYDYTWKNILDVFDDDDFDFYESVNNLRDMLIYDDVDEVNKAIEDWLLGNTEAVLSWCVKHPRQTCLVLPFARVRENTPLVLPLCLLLYLLLCLRHISMYICN